MKQEIVHYEALSTLVASYPVWIVSCLSCCKSCCPFIGCARLLYLFLWKKQQCICRTEKLGTKLNRFLFFGGKLQTGRRAAQTFPLFSVVPCLNSKWWLNCQQLKVLRFGLTIAIYNEWQRQDRQTDLLVSAGSWEHEHIQWHQCNESRLFFSLY